MATWKETYVNLAVAIDATLSDPTEDYVHIKEARTAIVDLTTIGDGSQLGYGTEASVRLLRDIDLLVRQSRLYFRYDTYIRNIVKSINNFTITFYSDLDGFINDLVWPDLCVPFYWEQISADGGTDTSNWTTCS